MLVNDLLVDRSAEDLAAELGAAGLTSKTGRPYSPRGIRNMGNREVPISWAPLLGPDDVPPAAGSESPSDGDQAGGRRGETKPPQRPRETPAAIVDPGARKRIAGAYKFAGAALAAGSGSQGVAVVWGDQADAIAGLWIDAAKDNPWAARFVNIMQAGGATGDLAAGHLYLAGATLYVLGAGIPGGDAIFAKYNRYRQQPPERPAEPDLEPPQPSEPEQQPANGDGGTVVDTAAGPLGVG